MLLLTPDILARLPALYSNENKSFDQSLAVVKFFTPDSNWTWYASEGSPVDDNGHFDTDLPKVDFVFFGLVDGSEAELGYFSLSELQHIRGPLGLRIERDCFFTPKTLQDLLDECNRRRGA